MTTQAQPTSPSPASARKRRTRAGSAPSAGKPRVEQSDDFTGAPRTGAKRTVMTTMKELPILRLLGGLLADARVTLTDKLLVAGAFAYILLPLDMVPDFIPFLGEVDDIFLLVMALGSG